eukprot:gene47830-64868_t
MDSMRALILAGWMLWLTAFAWPAGAEGYCQRQVHKGDGYVVCRIDPKSSVLRIHDLDPAGKPYRTFAALAERLRGDRVFLRLAMNGGMYQQDLTPV